MQIAKHLTYLIVSLLTVSSITACNNYDEVAPDQPFYKTQESLKNEADYIIRGKILDAKDIEGSHFPETVSKVDVISVAKGKINQRQIKLSYITPGVSPDAPNLKQDREYVFLLRNEENTFSLVNSTQGAYSINNNHETPTNPANTVTLDKTIRTALDLS